MHIRKLSLFVLAFICFLGCKEKQEGIIQPSKNLNIGLIGNNLCSRMLNYDHFEPLIQSMYPDSMIKIRNYCRSGDTPGFRPHSGRNLPWAFPGAEQFHREYANSSNSQGTFAYPDEWLSRYNTDVVLAFFGYNEAFESGDSLSSRMKELTAFIRHTKEQKYNGKTIPTLVIFSPLAYEDLSDKFDLPDGKKENTLLGNYTKMMAEVCAKEQISFVDLFTVSQKWYTSSNENLTIDGFQLTDSGYRKFATFLSETLFGTNNLKTENEEVFAAVKDKNWYWENFYKIPNGVHVFGRRYNPYGQENYPSELKKLDEMISNRDTLIWSLASGKKYDLAKADSRTTPIPNVPTNYPLIENKEPRYLYKDEVLATFKVPPGYKLDLFASEEDFPELANPVQMSFDNKGRLWVAVMPSYPHYKPGDSKPNDKLIILEDTNNDGKADICKTFADNLHLPIGFEFAPEGVYVSQSTHLKLLTDTNNDDKADKEEIILSGFDDHDTHHAISAFCADPSGAIIMAEGTFLHTNVETSYGPVRGTNGGFYRYNPSKKHLERYAQIPIPNPWGIAFDEWGQDIFAETSGPDVRWLMPSTIKPVYGISGPTSKSLFEPFQRVRPTSGLEFVSSRHFPDEVQGDLLINNTIGFLGMKQHSIADDGTGFVSCFRHDLVQSTDQNFRPVDMEFAPDGSLYFIDWHNVLVGHMQHNARDPLRDHVHGRVYRVTYPGRPLVVVPKIDGASISELLENLKLPEYRARYRTKRELRARNKNEVLGEIKKWTNSLNPKESRYEHHLLEAFWVSWGLNSPDIDLFKKLFVSTDHRVRAAVIRSLRYNMDKIPDSQVFLEKATKDAHGRVRLEALVTASWLSKETGQKLLANYTPDKLDSWTKPVFDAVVQNFTTRIKPSNQPVYSSGGVLQSGKENLSPFLAKGKEIYYREASCATCHQPDGKGLALSGFPPLASSEWVIGDVERLTKIILKGVVGPMNVSGKRYEGSVPMMAYEKILSDEEIAAVLSFVRTSFGNRADQISPETVSKIREKYKNKSGYFTTEEL